MQPIRRSVPNDNSCLFYAAAYLGEEGAAASHAVQRKLRKVVADAVLADADPATRGLMLGKPVEEYAEWIQNEFHWGGENEIVELCAFYGCRLAIVSAESLSVMTYGEGEKVGYILYTGQHYDPLVAAPSADAAVAEETRLFAGPGAELEAGFVALARDHNAAATLKASQKRVKRIKCLGCGAIVEDFQAHCGEVEHGDDFAYDCEEVELVFNEGDVLPEGTIDLSDEAKVVTYYNVAGSWLSNFYSAAVEVDGRTYATNEHAWQSLKFKESAPELAERIAAADTCAQAHLLTHGEGAGKLRADWDDVRLEIMEKLVLAKFRQHADLADMLRATADRTIVCSDSDLFWGMDASGGIAKGKNNLGVLLVRVRAAI